MAAREIGYWLVLHDLLAYGQHPDMICNFIRDDSPSRWKKPESVLFSKIRNGDRIVYYLTKHSLVVGVFEVVSDIFWPERDEHWSDIAAFRIKPLRMPPQGYFLDFKQLVRNSQAAFDMFPKKEIWYSYLQGQTAKKITPRDFRQIEKHLNNPKFLVPQERYILTRTDWHEKLSARVARDRLKVGQHFQE